ncbi:MAG TPA: hypothetical protein VGH08_12155, partial [Chthoniobacterales bacterium]
MIALLLVSSMAAQNLNANKISPEAFPEAPLQTSFLEPAAKPEKVFDKKFFAVMGSLGAAESLRFTSRKLVLEREYAAGAPWVSSVPSNQGMVAKDLALYSSEFLVAYELKKSHS